MNYKIIRLLSLTLLFMFFLVNCHQKADKYNKGFVDEISDKILQAILSNFTIQPLSKSHENLNLDKAYEIQVELSKKLTEEYGQIVGYKLGYSDSSSFKKNNITVPAYGPIFKSQIKVSGDTIPASDYRNFSIECEIVFIIDKNINKKVKSIDELISFVKSVHIGFDMSESIFDGPANIVDFVADGAYSKYFVLGKGLDPLKTNFTNDTLSIMFRDSVVYKGASKNVLGNPWIALKDVANDLVERGFPLKAGDVIFSGKVAPAYKIKSEFSKGIYKGSAKSFSDITVLVK